MDGILKNLGQQLFLQAYSAPEVRSSWIFYETEFANTFHKILTEYPEDPDRLRNYVSRRLDDSYELSAPSLLTPVMLYFFEEWVEIATSWSVSHFSYESHRLWASLEGTVILGGPYAFQGESTEPVVRYGNQQYYGLRPGDLRTVVDEATCLEMQRFLYKREQCLAWALPVWSETAHDNFRPESYEVWVKRAQARLSDPNYNPLKFCTFSDEHCWEEIKHYSLGA